MTVRLTSDLWVSAYLKRLSLALIPAYVTQRGDASAGAVLVKVLRRNHRAEVFQRHFDFEVNTRRWDRLAEGDEAEIDAMLARQKRNDPDLWLIEVEDFDGKALLDEQGLSE